MTACVPGKLSGRASWLWIPGGHRFKSCSGASKSAGVDIPFRGVGKRQDAGSNAVRDPPPFEGVRDL